MHEFSQISKLELLELLKTSIELKNEYADLLGQSVSTLANSGYEMDFEGAVSVFSVLSRDEQFARDLAEMSIRAVQ